MPPTTTPISSQSGNRTTYFSPLLLTMNTTVVIKLLTGRVWYKTVARIRGTRPGGDSRDSLATQTSPATKLPQEIIHAITAHLFDDKYSLFACSLTYYSWYIAAAPHLHRTLIIRAYPSCANDKFIWPSPLRSMHKLGLLPLVKRFQFIHGGCHYCHLGFSQKRFNRRTLRYFSALTNVQELGIDFLDIPGFIPRIRRYFGHFLPTLRSLGLMEPKGTCRQIVFFIGLFEHLENLKLRCGRPGPPEGRKQITRHSLHRLSLRYEDG